jgi:hypothetical protein
MPQATQNDGWARSYLALSMLPAVWEPDMRRADDDWRARPAAGTGFIPGSPPRLAGWITVVSCVTCQRRWRRVHSRRGAGAVPGPLWRHDRKNRFGTARV